MPFTEDESLRIYRDTKKEYERLFALGQMQSLSMPKTENAGGGHSSKHHQGDDAEPSRNESFTSNDDDYVRIKPEPIEHLDVMVESCLCRCCFKGLNLMEFQYTVDEHLTTLFRDLTGVDLTVCPQASSICEECFTQIQSMDRFKKLAAARKAKFDEISFIGGDLSEIFYLRLPDEAGKGSEEFHRKRLRNQEPLPGPSMPQTTFFSDWNPYWNSNVESTPRVKSRPTTTTHKRTRTPRAQKGERHICPICGKSLKDNVQAHMRRVHEKEKLFFCDICPYGAFRKNDLVTHMKTHIKDESIKKFHCEFCGFKTKKKQTLQFHVENMHSTTPRTKDFICHICSDSFLTNQNLDLHVKRVHQKLKTSKCELCETWFFDQAALKSHMKIQHEKKSEICHFCGKAFGLKRQLKAHLLTHGEAKFFCEYCKKEFFIESVLKLHIKRVHLNIRDHICSTCGKGFTNQYKLNRHSLLHSGIKFHCFVPGCTTTSTRIDAIQSHMKNNHNLTKEELEDYRKKLNEYWQTVKPHS